MVSASDLGVLGKCVAWRIIDFVLTFGLTLQQAKTIAVIQGGNESTLDRTCAQVSLHAHVTRKCEKSPHRSELGAPTLEQLAQTGKCVEKRMHYRSAFLGS